MSYVGFSGVANQANTTDGFALSIGAQNNPAVIDEFGLDVGDGGVVDIYHNSTPQIRFYILMENSGYVLQETDEKILLEIS